MVHVGAEEISSSICRVSQGIYQTFRVEQLNASPTFITLGKHNHYIKPLLNLACVFPVRVKGCNSANRSSFVLLFSK